MKKFCIGFIVFMLVGVFVCSIVLTFLMGATFNIPNTSRPSIGPNLSPGLGGGFQSIKTASESQNTGTGTDVCPGNRCFDYVSTKGFTPAQWDDQSGRGNHLVQASVPQQGTLYNGRVKFGIDQGMSSLYRAWPTATRTVTLAIKTKFTTNRYGWVVGCYGMNVQMSLYQRRMQMYADRIIGDWVSSEPPDSEAHVFIYRRNDSFATSLTDPNGTKTGGWNPWEASNKPLDVNRNLDDGWTGTWCSEQEIEWIRGWERALTDDEINNRNLW